MGGSGLGFLLQGGMPPLSFGHFPRRAGETSPLLPGHTPHTRFAGTPFNSPSERGRWMGSVLDDVDFYRAGGFVESGVEGFSDFF